MNNYFVTVNGLELASNLSKHEAINRGLNELKENLNLGMLQVGIGRYGLKYDTKTNKNIVVYTLLPISSFLD